MLDGLDLPIVKEGLCDVTGRRSSLRGPTEVELEISGQLSKQRVYVADEIAEPCIIGLDYLMANKCVIDFERRTLTIRDTVVPLAMGSRKTTPRTFRVKVRQSLTIPPSSETAVLCIADGEVRSPSGMVEADPALPAGVMVGRTLVDVRRPTFHVLMANLSDEPVRLHGDTVVGRGESVDVVESAGDAIKGIPGSSQLPEHVRQLMDGVDTNLTENEREQVRYLLAEFSTSSPPLMRIWEERI